MKTKAHKRRDGVPAAVIAEFEQQLDKHIAEWSEFVEVALREQRAHSQQSQPSRKRAPGRPGETVLTTKARAKRVALKPSNKKGVGK